MKQATLLGGNRRSQRRPRTQPARQARRQLVDPVLVLLAEVVVVQRDAFRLNPYGEEAASRYGVGGLASDVGGCRLRVVAALDRAGRHVVVHGTVGRGRGGVGGCLGSPRETASRSRPAAGRRRLMRFESEERGEVLLFRFFGSLRLDFWKPDKDDELVPKGEAGRDRTGTL